MSRFSDTVKNETPRIIVKFKVDRDKQSFEWGMVGKMPVLLALGYINRVQANLLQPHNPYHALDQQALCVVWLEDKKKFDYFIHRDAPVDGINGMLEIIKLTLAGTAQANQARNSQMPILGPDGQPIRR